MWEISKWVKVPPKVKLEDYTVLLQEDMSVAEKEIKIKYQKTFGTGLHQSTKMGARMLLEEVRRSKPADLLDVGTGTGILAFLAAKEGVKNIAGVDTNENALRAAEENRKENNIQKIEWKNNLDEVEKEYSLIVANITIYVWRKEGENIISKLAPEGKLILTGLCEGHTKELAWVKELQEYELKTIKNVFRPFIGVEIQKKT